MNDAPDLFYSPALGGYWVVTRHALADELLHRHDLFSNRQVAIPPVPDAPVLIPNNLDPPAHGRYRKFMMQKMFSARALGSLEQDFRALTHDILAEMAPRGQCEFLRDYARPAPVMLFLRMMGLPPQRFEQFMPWVNGVFRGTTPEQQAEGFAGCATFLSDWLAEKVADRAVPAGGHMLTAMLDADLDGASLSAGEMLSIAMMLLLGGLDTVTASMAHVMRFLAESPRHREQLLAEPALIPEAVEELLRRFGIANIGRVVATDIDFHGAPMRAGDMVLYSTPMLGLDRRRYRDPLEVDFCRDDKKGHLAFASGPHLCTGHLLARIELRVMLEELLPRLADLHVAPGAGIEYSNGGTLTMLQLPLEWRALTR